MKIKELIKPMNDHGTNNIRRRAAGSSRCEAIQGDFHGAIESGMGFAGFEYG